MKKNNPFQGCLQRDGTAQKKRKPLSSRRGAHEGASAVLSRDSVWSFNHRFRLHEACSAGTATDHKDTGVDSDQVFSFSLQLLNSWEVTKEKWKGLGGGTIRINGKEQYGKEGELRSPLSSCRFTKRKKNSRGSAARVASSEQAKAAGHKLGVRPLLSEETEMQRLREMLMGVAVVQCFSGMNETLGSFLALFGGV